MNSRSAMEIEAWGLRGRVGSGVFLKILWNEFKKKRVGLLDNAKLEKFIEALKNELKNNWKAKKCSAIIK
jgi:hypothetical protein